MKYKLIRILHITESHAKADGGVTTVVNDLTSHLNDLGVYSCVVAATDTQEPVPQGVDFVAMGLSCNKMSALFSTELKEKLRGIAVEKDIDVIHIHGVWMPLQVVAARLAKEMGIPFVLTAHGMYEPWLWTGKGWKGWLKKKLYFHGVTNPIFKHAAPIHGITPKESENLRRLFPHCKYETIPNAIDVVKKETVTLTRTIFFIGRITPVKGVDLLLKSFAAAKLSNDWKLVIAGPEEVPEYANELKQFVKQNALSQQANFVGAVYGDDKERLYQQAWVTVVPSYSEVVGMVNLEAALYACPTITTYQTGLSDWEEGGGLLINPEINALTKAIQHATSWSESERITRGEASLKLVEEKYSWDVVGKKWVQLYASLVNRDE